MYVSLYAPEIVDNLITYDKVTGVVDLGTIEAGASIDDTYFVIKNLMIEVDYGVIIKNVFLLVLKLMNKKNKRQIKIK